MYTKEVVYCGKTVIVTCDGKCEKAWGMHSRPKVILDNDEIEFLTDEELGTAPKNPGTYEGVDGKPLNAKSGADMNRWCVRECERCEMTER